MEALKSILPLLSSGATALAFVANLGALVGLYFTWKAWRRANSLQGEYMLLINVPRAKQELEVATSAFSNAIGSENQEEVLRRLNEMGSYAESIAENLPSEQAEPFTEFVNKIDEAGIQITSNDDKLIELAAESRKLITKASEIVQTKQSRIQI